ncbi:DUF2357 domain-containing protein [Thalassotalea profundi]|uniref:DUF2357 domain-containing protein n=1 Tax=Thalassotalea profundi TaxID=2036687 RepID=A0ABQ3J2B4_9GAMM|nr:DUF2357 domain-containing protein [Thalassotalea profundi]GHF02010.1 hypothetical protein GCM10011501_34280 [Thalassotalea profundi]
MITWYDRFNGKLVKQLPENIASGRYTPQESCILNGHSNIQPDDFLVSDGTEKFHIGSQVGSFIHNEKSELLEAELEIIESAILAYQEAIDLGRNSSFLIPDKLLARFELTKFEELLADILTKGHLQEIARRPRMELIYEENLVPVSRAKKIASSANAHLASHSECWQTRTLTGVIPKQILALESEDQLNIYENRVYVKLLGNIEQYLVKRILEVKKLEEIFKQAVSFQNAEGIYFELRDSIFTLWGEGFSDDEQTDDAAVHGIATLELLRKMLKKVRTLQHSALYLSLTHKIQVPLKLNMTNVLSHDQHYRHVARLWNSWLDTQQANNYDPEQIYQRNKKLADAYSQYCCDLVKRTLHELGFNELPPNCFKRNGNQAIYLEVTAGSEIVLKAPEHSLFFIPCFTNSIDLSDTELMVNSQRILLSLVSAIEMNEKHLCTAPTNFYSLEQLAVLISKWLISQTLQTIGITVSKAPSLLLKMLNRMNANGYWKLENNSITIIKPCLVAKPKLLEFKKEHKQDVSIAQAVDAVTEAAERFEELLYCPCCGAKADEGQWISREDNCFAIRNSSCNHLWEVNRQTNGNKVLKVSPNKVLDSDMLDDFERTGRFSILVNI